MSTASTQFEDERRMYSVIARRQREAAIREQIRLARIDQPSTGARLSTWAKAAMHAVVPTHRPRPRQEQTGYVEARGVARRTAES